MDGVQNVPLEGPFLTLDEFMRAQEIQSRLKRGGKKKCAPRHVPEVTSQTASQDTSSAFFLTTTLHECKEPSDTTLPVDEVETASSPDSNCRPHTSMSMESSATTHLGYPKKIDFADVADGQDTGSRPQTSMSMGSLGTAHSGQPKKCVHKMVQTTQLLEDEAPG